MGSIDRLLKAPFPKDVCCLELSAADTSVCLCHLLELVSVCRWAARLAGPLSRYTPQSITLSRRRQSAVFLSTVPSAAPDGTSRTDRPLPLSVPRGLSTKTPSAAEPRREFECGSRWHWSPAPAGPTHPYNWIAPSCCRRSRHF